MVHRKAGLDGLESKNSRAGPGYPEIILPEQNHICKAVRDCSRPMMVVYQPLGGASCYSCSDLGSD